MSRFSRMLGAALLLGGAVSIGATSASASPVQWTLQNFTFIDGATAQGSFVFDDDTDVFSTIAITTSGGTFFGPATYSFTTQFNAPPYIEFGNASPVTLGSFILDVIIASPLTNAGGIVQVLPGTGPIVVGEDSFYGICGDQACNGGSLAPLLEGASLTGTAVPEPASLALFGLGAGLLALRRRERA